MQESLANARTVNFLVFAVGGPNISPAGRANGVLSHVPSCRAWLNALAERWIQAVKTEVLSRIILFGERSLRHVLSEYIAHYHTERPHQGKGNVILFPSRQAEPDSGSPVACRERLGGLLKYYHRKAA
jgi:hypothetical protein